MIRPAAGLRTIAAALGAVLLGLLPAAPARADAQRDGQWYFGPMRLDEAQRLGNGGAGVTVAVLDTGVDTDHQDLLGALVPGRYMAGDLPFDGVDTGPHGTGIAVLIGGRGHGSGRGLLGVAPRCKIMPIRPVNDRLLAANGIRWAVAHGAKVINMSFDLEGGDTLRAAVAEAAAADVVLVGAVGNGGGTVVEPTVFPGVLGVGSVDRNDRITSFSNHGEQVDLVTYGIGIPVARPRDRYDVANGTSDSSALVAGAAALLRSRYPDMSAAEVVDRLTGTATDRGPKGRDDRYGAGELNLIAALTAPRTPPSAVSAPPPVTDARVAAPAAAAPAGHGTGPPSWLLLIVGVLLLIVGLAVLMIVRARRSP
jgi:subtilisin family serine protease